MIKNSKGNVYYGMHFYPGVAEYAEPGKDPYRVFLNEDTIRSMDPTFAGRPIYVEHVDEVESNIDELRKEADGWVIESFFNSADGKHWVKFISVSERAEKAIKAGMRLSNAYIPKSFGQGGMWNGVTYQKEITGGEFEHLAIVRNPRYEESVIMTPDQFKQYNEEKVIELKRLANGKDQKETKEMAFKLFKRQKVENSTDIEGMHVVLPKSGREVSITQLVNEMDEAEEKKKANDVPADPAHKVKLHDGSMCNVGELVEKHKAMADELAALKAKKEDEIGLETEEVSPDVESAPEMENEDEADDADAKKKALEIAEHEDKEMADAKKKNAKADNPKSDSDDAKKAAKEKADKLRNANTRHADEEVARVEFSDDMVSRGRSRYGS